MKIELKNLVAFLKKQFPGIVTKMAFGEMSFFYNPGNKLPNGIYFLTVKQDDGPHDNYSKLYRKDIYRLSFKPLRENYEELFGDIPAKPEKGAHLDLNHDFSEKNVLMPHPIYAWMGWVMILSPNKSTFQKIYPLIQESYEQAVDKFKKKR